MCIWCVIGVWLIHASWVADPRWVGLVCARCVLEFWFICAWCLCSLVWLMRGFRVVDACLMRAWRVVHVWMSG